MKPTIVPFGVGDLMVVKQDLARYEPGEVAHVENVMATEKRGREHRRLRRTEETFVVEQEHLEESQRDLQSTERFELKQETQKTVVQDTKFQIGAEISGKFGPVQVGVNSEFSTSNSKTESDRRATEYAKEVVDKSINKIVDRVRQERTTKTTEEFEEKNFHSFENTDGDHKTGVYRWVDKFYRVKVVNYGKRLFYEFIVPEPAAFHVYARLHAINTSLLPLEPEPPHKPGSDTIPLSPAHITPENYLGLVARSGAQGAIPPPRQLIRLTRILTREVQPDTSFSFVDNELEIPAGYVRTKTWIARDCRVNLDDFYVGVHYPKGWAAEDQNDTYTLTTSVTFSGRYPIGVRGHGVQSILATVTIACERTDEALNEWRLKIYQVIMDAYNKERVAYEEQLAAARIQGAGQIGGNNPVINRMIEREELKKSCISMWTGFQYDGPSGITHVTPHMFPQVHLANAAGMRVEIKFLEQSFDWTNLAYEFYPYFWGRKSKWLEANTFSDDDPLFTEFLRAGAARVLVPVHPAFTAQVLYYQLTGTLWPTSEVPLLDPPNSQDTLELPNDAPETELDRYKAYVAELTHSTAADDLDKVTDIDPDDTEAWMVKVPTNLVWLQPDATLPEFD